MGNGVGTQCTDAEIRCVIYQSAIFGAQRKVAHQGKIDTAPITEDSNGLPLGPGNGANMVVGRVKQ